jgi:drug/metabolite transporter (DMT)-like permease
MIGRPRLVVVGVFVTLLWSSSWVLVRWGDTQALDPVTFAACRYVLASVVLGAAALGWHRPAVVRLVADRSAMLRVALLGLSYYALTQAAQFVAIVNQPAATTSLVLSATSIAVAVLAFFVLGERSSRATVLGGVVLVAGAVVYLRGDLGFTAVGLAASLAALAGNSASTLLGRAVNGAHQHPPVVVTAASMAIGAAALALFALTTRRQLPAPTWRLVGVVAWMVLVNTAFAFTVWSWVLRHLDAADAAVINNLMLPEIAVLGWLALGERPAALDAVGIAIVLAGTILANVRRRARRSATGGEVVDVPG